jgi:DNA-dependent RNA polymerase auxiliary subunit epsilon
MKTLIAKFFSRSRKREKLAASIFVEVQDLAKGLEQQVDRQLNTVNEDYLIGFVDELANRLLAQEEKKGVKLDRIDKDSIVFLVIEHCFGKGILDHQHWINLRKKHPTFNLDFICGYKDAEMFLNRVGTPGIRKGLHSAYMTPRKTRAQ